MRLYNTLTRKKEEFTPLEENKVKMYVCGPTVYNYFHVGNARPFIIFEAFRNYLKYRGYQVKFVQNFTDVDDKIIKKAQEEGMTPLEVADKYIAEYFKDVEALGIKPADVHPRVTDHVRDIIAFVEELIQKGYAYEMEGDVYFDSKTFQDYGKLSKQNIGELNLGARINVNEMKKHPVDFALWKKKKEGEIGWPSPWGEGRPGWHIECSVMAKKHLGDTIDIHAGGQDLIFPHHENEIAQSESHSGKDFARYWIHNGFINIDNEKMSKSLGNFFTIREILEKYEGRVIRFFMLSAHYRNPVNFSQEMLEQAKAGLERITNAKERLLFMTDHASGELTQDEEAMLTDLYAYREQFITAMDDDINTADGISAIFELVKFANIKVTDQSSGAWMNKNLDLLEELTGVLNIAGLSVQQEDNSDIELLIAERATAKKDKDFARADQIRDQLTEMGIEIEDTRQGTKWKKIN